MPATLAGAPANVAVQAHRAGVSAGFLGRGGQGYVRGLPGGHPGALRRGDPGPIPGPGLRHHLGLCAAQPRGRPGFQLFTATPARTPALRYEDVDLSLLEPCKLLCFGSLLLTAEPSRSTVERLVRYAKAQGKITAYDPNWRPPLWKGREEEGVQRMKSLIPLADIMKVSGEELELLTGKESLEEGAWALLEQGVSLAVVTLGARGCKAFAPGLSLEKPTYDTKVKDTTGSGDSFFGALLARIIQSGKRPEQLSPEELGDFLDFANAAGSTCATKTGAIPALPTTQEIEACRRNVPLLHV